MADGPAQIDSVLADLSALPGDWHDCGLLSIGALRSIARHAGPGVAHTVETGSGSSTIFFSHLSASHITFSVDDGRSISQVWKSSLFRPSAVRLVEGPTQLTMPSFVFEDPIDVALIDGPHGYPFPDLEYYYIYPHVRTGGLLVVDDVHIPTIRNLFKFLREDAMWDLVEVVRGRTAIFRRTDAPTFSPTGDGWWLQLYNFHHVPMTPLARLRSSLPAPLRRRLKALLGRR